MTTGGKNPDNGRRATSHSSQWRPRRLRRSLRDSGGMDCLTGEEQCRAEVARIARRAIEEEGQ